MNTSNSTVAVVLLSAFLLNLAIAFGAGIYEHRIVLPEWIVTSEGTTRWDASAAKAHDTGRRFWAFVSTGPLTLLTITNLFFAWRASGSVRTWWLVAVVAALLDRTLTFSWFIPTMIRLLDSEGSPDAVATAVRWGSVNHLRHVLTFIASVAAVVALGRLSFEMGRSQSS